MLQSTRMVLKERFPIWFDFRQYQRDGEPQLVFKIWLYVSPEEKEAAMRHNFDISYNLLTSVGVNIQTVQDIFVKVDYEDLRPFMAKIMNLVSYIRENRHIQNPDAYILSAMDIWFSDWLERYSPIDRDDFMPGP